MLACSLTQIRCSIGICGSREEVEYRSALDYMNKSGADIKTTEMVLFEFLKSAKHQDFKAIQALIK